MRHDRLTRFLGLSLGMHLFTLLCGATVTRNLNLPTPVSETVCFVTVVSTPSRGDGGPKGGERSLSPMRANASVSVLRSTHAMKAALPKPTRPETTTHIAPSAEPKVPKKEMHPPLAASSVPIAPSPSPSGPCAGTGSGMTGSGVGGRGIGGTGDTGKGGSHGGTGDAPPGEVGFGTASGISYAHQVKPLYPALAKRFNREGRVTLRLTISETGALVRVDVLEDPGFGLASAAVEAVRRSRFTPARRAGRPFTAQALLPVRFTLSNGE